MTNPHQKIITPLQRWPASASVFFVRGNSQHNALRCQPAPLRIPPLSPLSPPPQTPPAPLPPVAPFGRSIYFVCFSLRSKHMGSALKRGDSSRSACSARSLRCPLAPLSLASLAGASGWRLVLLLRRVVTLLLVAPFGRTPPLPFGLAVVAAARLAARRSCAVGRLRSLPACRSSPRPGLRRLPLRVCAPCPHRRLGLMPAVVPLSSGGAAAWLVRRFSFGAAPAWRALCCCARPLPSFPAPPGFPRRRCVPADAPLPGSAAAVPRRAAALLRSAPSAALFPPLRSGHPLAARRSFGGRPLSPAAVVCARSWRSSLRAGASSLHARSGCSARGGLRMRQSRAHFRWFLGVVTPRPPFPTLAQRRWFSAKNSCLGRPLVVE